MIQIKIADVEINIHNGPIGISCSGGADSALLLYILMKFSKDPIHIFTCSVDIKNRSTIRSASNVVSKIIDLTENHNIYQHYHFIKESPTLDELFKQQMFFLKNKLINCLYTAITQNPPYEVHKDFKEISTEIDERNSDTLRPLYALDNPIYMPFRNINKKIIANMYKELGLMNTLFPITRSCESLTLTEGHCGECWWCEERMWGFGRLT